MIDVQWCEKIFRTPRHTAIEFFRVSIKYNNAFKFSQ